MAIGMYQCFYFVLAFNYDNIVLRINSTYFRLFIISFRFYRLIYSINFYILDNSSAKV
jgi:hypothetical protein